ncbi:MAG TPA: response regulator transcription factor [Actinomycetota bacterium]|nr:response regulator transcription factor [Actinomycetota bacterium]
MTTVLVVDDQALVRSGFRMIIDAEDDLSVVGEAEDGAGAIAETRRLRPDVVLMDIRMPKLDGIEATRRLVRQNDPVKILILTTFDLDEYVVEALRAGASGFLLKDAPSEQLVEAIRVVARDEALLSPRVTRRLLDRFIDRLRVPDPAADVDLQRLTEREREVLRLVAKGRSNAEIAKELFLGETTVKTHVSNVLSKLQLRDRVQAVVHAYETGLIRPGE